MAIKTYSQENNYQKIMAHQKELKSFETGNAIKCVMELIKQES